MIKVCVIGLGNMGQAICEALGSMSMFKVTGCKKGDDVNACILDSDVNIIAVKPQSFGELARSISVDWRNRTVVSIMAGVTISNIFRKLSVKKVIRVMPNLPLKVGRALSAWTCSESIDEEEKAMMKSILGVFGEEIEVDNEDDIDLIAAMSASGPAYYAYLTEQIVNFARQRGFSEEDAHKIANTTFVGTAQLLDKEGYSAEELRARITSKGGITTAAIEHMEARGFDKIFMEGIEAAIKRTKELNES